MGILAGSLLHSYSSLDVKSTIAPGNHSTFSISSVSGKACTTHPSSVSITYCFKYPYSGRNKKWEAYLFITNLQIGAALGEDALPGG